MRPWLKLRHALPVFQRTMHPRRAEPEHQRPDHNLGALRFCQHLFVPHPKKRSALALDSIWRLVAVIELKREHPHAFAASGECRVNPPLSGQRFIKPLGLGAVPHIVRDGCRLNRCAIPAPKRQIPLPFLMGMRFAGSDDSRHLVALHQRVTDAGKDAHEADMAACLSAATRNSAFTVISSSSGNRLFKQSAHSRARLASLRHPAVSHIITSPSSSLVQTGPQSHDPSQPAIALCLPSRADQAGTCRYSPSETRNPPRLRRRYPS